MISFVPILGFMLVGGGMVLQWFSMWQLDMLLCSRMWSTCDQNIQFYTDLKGNNMNHFREMKWTINFELWPNMTAGVAYDLLMVMNYVSWFLTAIGVYMVVAG